MKVWKCLIIKIFVVLNQVNCDDENEIQPGEIAIWGISDQQPEVSADILYTCIAKFDCQELAANNGIKCDKLEDLIWFVPRELREHELMFGNISMRVVFDKQEKYFVSKSNTELIVKSVIRITSFGTIHKGKYLCTHDRLRSAISFEIKTNGNMETERCNYNDHCNSTNCYQNLCKCKESEVYIRSADKCLPVSSWESGCEYDDQCTFVLGTDSAQCSRNQCICRQTYTLCSVPMIGKKCLKSASLNNECKNRDQCTDNQTYCSDKNICECKSGYNLSGNKCIAIKSCDSSELGFNEHYIRGDCDQNEFCRNSVCLCLPNYLAQGDQCVNRDDDDRPWLERYGYYIIGGLAAFLVITVFLTVIQVKKRRQRKQNQRTQQNSKDPLNSVNTE